MLPHTIKKKAKLSAVVAYLGNMITGDEFVSSINHEVEIGNELGKTRTSNLPYTLFEGTRLKYMFSLERTRAATRISVPPSVVQEILRAHVESATSIRKLSSVYGYGTSVIERILRKPWRT